MSTMSDSGDHDGGIRTFQSVKGRPAADDGEKPHDGSLQTTQSVSHKVRIEETEEQ
ncbi:hypothetical protein SARC_13684, partial [Sphaeroforma arctica JP610]